MKSLYRALYIIACVIVINYTVPIFCIQRQQPHTQAYILAQNNPASPDLKTVSVLEKLCGKEIISYAVTECAHLQLSTTVIIDPTQESEKNFLLTTSQPATIAITENTAQALMQTWAQTRAECIIVVRADMPLITKELIQEAYAHHIQNAHALTIVQAQPDENINTSTNESTDDNNNNTSSHMSAEQAAGICIIDTSLITAALNNFAHTHRDSWLATLIETATYTNQSVLLLAACKENMMRVTTPPALIWTTYLQQEKLIDYWIDHGVVFSDPDSVHIDAGVTIGQNTIIESGVHITGATTIGQHCHLHPYSILNNTTLQDNVIIFSHSVLDQATVGAYTQVGPFAHLHNTASIADHSAIGNYVEIQLSSVGSYTKARHLTYLGHAHIGNKVNIGVGTITCNYDGRNKNPTVIEDNTFIGSNNTLVAPITIKQGSFTAAGSVITDPVPENTFAIGRARQVNKIDYAQQLRAKVQQKNQQKQESR